ncbi:MAG: glycolate oxidase subunit GlcE [Pseudomonadota bacterium]|jgi:glycolate oxidase FAD binding subunit
MKEFADIIIEAAARNQALRIRGGGTKDFYGGPLMGEILDTRNHQGIINYEPSELYLTARAGTPLGEIEATLAEHDQMLAFEPPHFGAGATLGGAVAAGLAGPRRASSGGLRDFMLGVVMLDGRGQRLSFGGQVMKNVAGFDVSRLMCGALGTLGLMLEISIKVLPRPRAEVTLQFELSASQAIERFNGWAGQPLPISATSALAGCARVRLSGGDAAVKAACQTLGGERVDDTEAHIHWASLREHTHPFFTESAEPLWRIASPPTAPAFSDEQLIEWGGGQRWWHTRAPDTIVRPLSQALGGHATLFRGEDKPKVFAPIDPVSLGIQRKLKAAFDPANVFNRGRLGDL